MLVLGKVCWQIKLKQNIEERVENRNKRQRENGLYRKFCIVRSKDTSVSDSVYFLKRVFLVVSYSSLYLPSIIISLLSPPFFFLQLRIRMYLFKAGLPQSHFVTHLSDSETPTGKKEKKKAKKIFPCLYSVSKSAKFSSAKNKLSFFTTIKERLNYTWAAFFPPSLPSGSFLTADWDMIGLLRAWGRIHSLSEPSPSSLTWPFRTTSRLPYHIWLGDYLRTWGANTLHISGLGRWKGHQPQNLVSLGPDPIQRSV